MATPVGTSGMRDALIMEPDPALARAIGSYLPDGALVDVTGTAAEGLQLLQERNYRLLFCADDLPDLPGLMVLAQTQDQWPSMQRILLCADVDGEFLLHALKSGSMLHYLPKPVDAEATRNLIAYVLGQQRLVSELLASRSLLVERELQDVRRVAGRAGGRSVLEPGFSRALTISALALLLLLAILLTGLVGFYLLKSSFGLNFFPDSHLEDFFFD